LTIWWQQQDDCGANRSFGVFSAQDFFRLIAEPAKPLRRMQRCEALPPFQEIVQPLSPPSS
jgi:hypothetical protein